MSMVGVLTVQFSGRREDGVICGPSYTMAMQDGIPIYHDTRSPTVKMWVEGGTLIYPVHLKTQRVIVDGDMIKIAQFKHRLEESRQCVESILGSQGWGVDATQGSEGGAA